MKYEDIFTFHNLYKAHLKTRKGKMWKKEVMEFELNKAHELRKLYEELRKKTYKISPYRTFTIYEPKKRRVDATSYRDRIVQNCFVDNYLFPLLENHLIYDNAACRKEKGTDFARKRLKKFMLEEHKKRKETYVLTYDIHHYFESIDHAILLKKMKKLIKDDEIYSFVEMIVSSFKSDEGKGLPLGNQTSQCFALYYLDSFDRIIKERYSIHSYSRYMDDGVIISKDKEKLKSLLESLRKELEDIKLSFNPKKTSIYPLKEGVTYLGFTYRIGKNDKTIVKMAKNKRKRLIAYLSKYEHTHESLLSYKNYLSMRADEYSLIRRLKTSIDIERSSNR